MVPTRDRENPSRGCRHANPDREVFFEGMCHDGTNTAWLCWHAEHCYKYYRFVEVEESDRHLLIQLKYLPL